VFKNVLLLYKKSAYKIYFLDRKGFTKGANKKVIGEQLKKFKKAHEEHYQTLKTVTQVLIEEKIGFSEFFRGQRVNYDAYDLIITVGGDGTFLEAARHARSQIIIGVNSAPGFSTGSFCAANRRNFRPLIRKILKQRYSVRFLERLRVKFDSIKTPFEALNDILICHENPAMMCRYILKIGRRSEEQRSSGLWVATPAGSSGAVLSAGGKLLDRSHKLFQYVPRELYPRHSKIYNFKGGIIRPHRSFKVVSLMRGGLVYVDGAHVKVPFEYGESVSVTISPSPVRTVKVK